MGAATQIPTEQTLPFPATTGEPAFRWYKHPKSFVDELILKGKLAPGIECWILEVIERFTSGADGKPEYYHVSYADLARMFRVTPQAIAEPLKRLERVGIIASIPKGENTPPGEKRGYKLTPDNWPAVRVYMDPAERVARRAANVARRAAKKAEKAAAAAAQCKFFEDHPGAVEIPPAKEETINASISVEMAKDFITKAELANEPAFDLPIRCLNGADVNLAFATVVTATGIDVFTQRTVEAARETTLHADSGAPVTDVIKKRIKGEPMPTVVGGYTVQATDNKEAAELLAFVVEKNGNGAGKAPHADVKPKAQSTERGTRFTLTTLPDEYAEWAKKQLRWSIERSAQTFAIFGDYWRAKPGEGGRKTDWPATWRNWCRRTDAEQPNGGRGSAQLQQAPYQHRLQDQKSTWPLLPVYERPED